MTKQWYYQWFNSPYYHVLYKNRNSAEAENLINNIYAYLKPQRNAHVLDVGCGRGRHALCLAEKGLLVTGIDLAVENISYARQFESAQLRFFVHDMRSLYYENYFDIALNLFTSFGYFDTWQEDLNVLSGLHRALKPGGMLVIDFFNADNILQHITPAGTRMVDGIEFRLTRHVNDKNIVKTIDFEDEGRSYYFTETVKTFTLDDFKALFKATGFELVQVFGNYNLDAFDAASSDRLIMLCSKTHV